MSREMPHVDGVEHRQVVANGIRIHLAEAGDPGAPPVICLHGWPQHWYLWRNLIGPLAESRRVICPDLRGLGWSEAPRDGYEKEGLTDDLLALLDVLEIERASLVGHDWGGFVTFLACLRQPERFDRHVALNVAPPLARRTARTFASAWRFWYQVVFASPSAPASPRASQPTAASGGSRTVAARPSERPSWMSSSASSSSPTAPARAAATTDPSCSTTCRA